MRIGFDAKRAFHNFRGLGNYSRDLLASLSKYYQKNSYILFTPPYSDERAIKWKNEYSNFEIVLPSGILGKKFSSAWRSLYLSEEIKKKEIDIFHGLSHELPPGIAKTGVKTIVTIHDLIFMRYPEQFSWVDRQVYLKKVSYACSVADRVVAICQQTKQDLISLLAVDEKKIVVVYQTCNPRFYTLCSSDKIDSVLAKYKIKKDYILSVGALEERKNTLHLVKAFKSIRNDISQNLLIIGNGGKYKDELVSYIENNGLEDRVTILSDVTHVDLPSFYQAASLFCYPSLFEGFGIPIIEALFSKTPVLTSKGGVFPEAGGPSSCYVDPLSLESISLGIKEILGNKDLAYKMREEGRNFVEKFHRSKTSQAMYEVYEELIGRQ